MALSCSSLIIDSNFTGDAKIVTYFLGDSVNLLLFELDLIHLPVDHFLSIVDGHLQPLVLLLQDRKGVLHRTQLSPQSLEFLLCGTCLLILTLLKGFEF